MERKAKDRGGNDNGQGIWDDEDEEDEMLGNGGGAKGGGGRAWSHVDANDGDKQLGSEQGSGEDKTLGWLKRCPIS